MQTPSWRSRMRWTHGVRLAALLTIFAITAAGRPATAGEIEDECPDSCGFARCESSDLCQDEMKCKDQEPECSKCTFSAACASGDCPAGETYYKCCASSSQDFGGCEVD